MGKVAITVNGAEPKNLYPPFILGSSALASGDDVILFFTPGGAPALKKGVLEEIKAKGMPDMAELVEGLTALGGRILLCELAFEAKDHLLVVDDYVPGTGSGDEATMDRLFRGATNVAGRTRMRGSSYHPRCLVLSTGESLPERLSLVARTVVLRLRDEVNWERLTVAQERAREGIPARFLAGLIEWLAPRREVAVEWVRERFGRSG